MQKKLKNDELYYVINNLHTKLYNDWFIFGKYKEIPLLEKYFFEIMTKELIASFETKTYSSSKYKALLLVLYNICLDGDRLNIKSSNLLSNLYLNVRYKDFVSEIDAFKGKFEESSIETCKNNLMKKTYADISAESKRLFDIVKAKIGKDKTNDDVFKEIMFLCVDSEYEKAKSRANKMHNLIQDIKQFAKNENIEFDNYN